MTEKKAYQILIFDTFFVLKSAEREKLQLVEIK